MKEDFKTNLREVRGGRDQEKEKEKERQNVKWEERVEDFGKTKKKKKTKVSRIQKPKKRNLTLRTALVGKSKQPGYQYEGDSD